MIRTSRSWTAECSGDSAAGNQLVLRHFDSLYRFFDNKLGSDIDELIQTTFLACVRSRDQFRRQSSFRTYLFTIARHELYRHLRERQRHSQDIDVDEMSILDLGTSPTGKLARSQEHKLLLFALRSLSVEQQVLLELHYWESMSPAELAEVFGITQPATHMRLSRARKALRECMETMAGSSLPAQTSLEDLDAWARQMRAQAPRRQEE